MKIRHPVVMFLYIFPDLIGMFMITIKGTVYKFNLLHMMFQEKIQLLKDQRQAPQPHAFFHGSSSILAGSLAGVI